MIHVLREQRNVGVLIRTCHVVLGASSATLAMGTRDHRTDILDAADTCPDLRYHLPKVVSAWHA